MSGREESNVALPAAVVETFRAARNLLTPHGPQHYPGVLVVRPDPRWERYVIVAEEGTSFIAAGGERAYSYRTVDGGRAQGFVLRSGDHATQSRSGLDYSLAEWVVRRNGSARE
jgi:hypothetical protein